MEKDHISLAVETLLFSAAGGFGVGFISGMALKRIIKIAAIILGAFFLGLMFLQYKGLVSINWPLLQTQTQSVAYNATIQAQHMINSTMAQISTHPNMMAANGLAVSAGVAFLPGVIIGLRH